MILLWILTIQFGAKQVRNCEFSGTFALVQLFLLGYISKNETQLTLCILCDVCGVNTAALAHDCVFLDSLNVL